MNVLEKLGAIYARMDCSNRACRNCAIEDSCRNGGKYGREFIHEISEEVRSIIKERDELLAKLKEVETK